jgi:ABC-type transport system involved in cytochrome c biogenesis permease subunit
MSGISITCFAASYAVALALEVSRLLFRSGVRGAIMLGFAGAGLFAHTVFLFYRAAAASGSPLSSEQDWYLVAAWALVVLYLYLVYYHPRTAFGLFILPLVLGLVGVGAFVADAEPFARGPASRIWGAIHGTSLLLATVTVLTGSVAGLMYLGQAYRLKRKLPPKQGLRLPSLEWLQRANSRAIVVSLLLVGIGILSGVILNLVNYGSDESRVPWTDPFLLSTMTIFVWLLLSAGILLVYKPAREGRKVALLTLVSFVFLVIALAVGLSVETQHLRPRSDQGRSKAVPGTPYSVLGSRNAPVTRRRADTAHNPNLARVLLPAGYAAAPCQEGPA